MAMESDPKKRLKWALRKGDAEGVWEVLFAESRPVGGSISEAVDPNCEIVCDLFVGTPLSFAAFYGHIYVVRVLLSHPECRVNHFDGAGWTALNWAVYRSHIDVVKLLLDHPDIELECKDMDGMTPSGCCRTAEMAALLLGHGADPNPERGMYGTPLDRACFNGTLMQVRVLLERGANPLIGDPLKKANLPEKLKLLRHYIDGAWKDGVPSLADQCTWKMKRMKSKVDQGYMVNERLPDALVAKHFNDWEGAAKWCVPWLPEMIEDANEEVKEVEAAGLDGLDNWQRRQRERSIKEAKAEVARLEAMLESGLKDMEEWEAAGRPSSGTQWIERETVEEFRARMGRWFQDHRISLEAAIEAARRQLEGKEARIRMHSEQAVHYAQYHIVHGSEANVRKAQAIIDAAPAELKSDLAEARRQHDSRMEERRRRLERLRKEQGQGESSDAPTRKRRKGKD